ncbi:MAG: hypothetical protein AAGG44_18625, partial [Planctomycetota bacterium]
SYVRTGYKAASQAVSDSVPIEWELKRARDMIEELKPEIEKNLQVVAREEVGVQQLAAEIESKETLLAKSQEDILRLKGDLEKGVRFVYRGRSYSENQVREDLSRRFKKYKDYEATTEKLTQVLAAREKNLDAARSKVEEMVAARRELEIEVENLQARMTLLDVARTSSPVALDDSHLSDTKQLLQDIRTRIEVADKMVANEGVLTGEIQLGEEATSPELLDEIADYFGDEPVAAESEVLLSTHRL